MLRTGTGTSSILGTKSFSPIFALATPFEQADWSYILAMFKGGPVLSDLSHPPARGRIKKGQTDVWAVFPHRTPEEQQHQQRRQ